MITDFLQAHLSKREKSGLLRALPRVEGLIDLSSNDYLGFARTLRVGEETKRVGSTGSRLLTGNCSFYEELEREIASFHQAEGCLIYNTGYTANLGLISALGTSEVTFLYDLEIHASMRDGMALCEARCRPFRHNDLDSLENRLKEASFPTFVLVESVYSISGELAPLKEMAALCLRYRANLIVDEAHATGIYGPNGEGRVVELNLTSEVFARVHTFSKALGVHGGCVLGDQLLLDYLINFSRPFIYTTALCFPSLLQIKKSYQKLQLEVQMHQENLRNLVSYFQKRFSLSGPFTPIQPIYVGEVERTRALAKKIQQVDLDVRAIVSPTVKRGCECLRVVLHSFNTEQEIDRLAEVF